MESRSISILSISSPRSAETSSPAAVGVGALGLPGAPPGLCLAAGALTAVACAPVCALQSAISAFTRSFALPVAAGLCLTGVGTTMLLAHVPGGHPLNPLGVRALYLGSSMYRIHGTDAPWTIGTAVSKGCIRMYNEDELDLYPRIPTGTRVTVTWQRFKG